jgi:thioredoxin reductase/bacterioferritin-associated ferredoxin
VILINNKRKYDVIVIGAGPSGVSAAINCAKRGLKVLIVDSNSEAGGQIYRAPPKTYKSMPKNKLEENEIQKKMSIELKKYQIDTAYNHTVWQVSPGFKVNAFNDFSTIQWETKSLIIATGTYEKIIPFEGWTIPGVIGLAACTVMLKSHHFIPSNKIILAGNGPLLILVAYYISKFGGKVDAIIDTCSKLDWIRSTLSLITNQKNFSDGIKWIFKIFLNRIPIHSNCKIEKAVEVDGGIKVKVLNLKTGKYKNIFSETIAIGHGLTPSTDITRLLKAEHIYDEHKGGWIAKVDRFLRSSINGVYLSGDGAGISGALAASDKGLLASTALLYDKKIISKKEFDTNTRKIKKKLDKYEVFAKAISKLNSIPKKLIENIHEDTIICRCEDITKKEILSAVDQGAKDINQIKSWTRLGMGPCQGRTCQYAASKIVAEYLNCEIENLGYLTGRSPIRPVPLDRVLGDFDYEKITKVEAAPL